MCLHTYQYRFKSFGNLYWQVYFELNGVTREVRVFDRRAEIAANQSGTSGVKRTVRADKSNLGHGTNKIQIMNLIAMQNA